MNDMAASSSAPTPPIRIYSDPVVEGADGAISAYPPYRLPPLTRLGTAARLLQTTRHLKPIQALFWALRRTLGRSYRVPHAARPSTRAGTSLSAVMPVSSSGLAGNAFTFLNASHDFGDRIAWHDAGRSRLWLYNLHYFDYALDPARSPEWIVSAIRDWISRNPPLKSVGWEPYPASLRIVNWIKFDLWRTPSTPLAGDCRRSLFQQVAWLERNLEHEIQANHLLKNLKAIVFGGAYFAGRTADRWLQKGTRLFLREIRRQILADGGHFERTAMYHAIVLEDLLDVLNLAVSNKELMPRSTIEDLTELARAALAHLDDVTFPDGSISMFNDSVSGIAPERAALLAYGSAISPALGDASRQPSGLVNRPASGLYGYRQDGEMLLIDAGRPSPDFQPGHSHCGLLGFELMVGRRPFIVDSGVHDYEVGGLRHQLRSTAAHNTVRLDGAEQSDIWGAFRIGRRATPRDIRFDARLPHQVEFSASHDGFFHLPGRPVHQRTIHIDVGKRWRIVDQITGSGVHRLESFLHFHPDLEVHRTLENWVIADEDGIARCRIEAIGGKCEVVTSLYCPAFGVRRNNLMLRLSAEAPLPAVLEYIIEAI